MNITRVLSPLALALVVPALAVAAPKAGPYKGTSSSVIPVLQADGTFADRTFTGKVAFRVAGKKVTGFSVKGQQAFCNTGPVPLPLAFPAFSLNAAGSGTVTKVNPNVGPITLKLRVTAAGRATGTITFIANGICKAPIKVAATG